MVTDQLLSNSQISTKLKILSIENDDIGLLKSNNEESKLKIEYSRLNKIISETIQNENVAAFVTEGVILEKTVENTRIAKDLASRYALVTLGKTKQVVIIAFTIEIFKLFVIFLHNWILRALPS